MSEDEFNDAWVVEEKRKRVLDKARIGVCDRCSKRTKVRLCPFLGCSDLLCYDCASVIWLEQK